AVYFGFRRARAQLDVARDDAATDEAANILWRTALRAEYGGAADTRRAMEQAQRDLAEAIANGAPKERIAQLVEALRQGANRYLQALMQEALRNGNQQNNDDTQDQGSISQQDIENMLQQVQRLTEQGRTQEAQQLLQMLAQMMANLNAQLDNSGEGGQG